MKSVFLFVFSILLAPALMSQTWEDVGGGLNWSAHSLGTWDGKLVVGGSMNSPCKSLAVWDGTSYDCLDEVVDKLVRATCEWEGNLVIVGDFWNVGQPCTDCNGVAYWDGTSWNSLGTGFNNDVLAVINWDGTLVAAGDFTEADDVPCSRIAWWDGTGWQPFGGPSDFDNDIRTMAIFEDELWVGGDFNNVAGCTPCDGVVRWDGTAWLGGDSGVDIQGGVNETIRNLFVSPTDGNLYMGGEFTELNIDGTIVTEFNGIGMYDGSAWSPLDDGVNDYVRALTEHNGNIFVGGAFTDASGTPVSRVAKWNLSTLSWEALGSGVDGTSDIPVVKASTSWNGAYYAGGTFDEAGGISAPKIAKWTEPLGPFTTGIGSSLDETCDGDCDGEATATATGGTPPYTYLWDDAGAQTTATANGLCPGTYNCTITDDVGASSVETVTIVAAPPLAASASVTSSYSGEDVSCNGSTDGEATAVPTGGTGSYTYLWDASAGSQTTATATGLGAGTYDVIITDDNGCSQVASVTVTEPTVLDATIPTSTDVLCFGDLTGSADGSVSGGTTGYTYLWDDPSAQTTLTATGLGAGTFCVTVTDANGCVDVECVTISEPAELTSTASATSSFGLFEISCFGELDGSATAPASGGVGPYSWLWDDPSAQTTEDATGLGAGTYNVTITDDNGCTVVGTVTLTEPTEITATTASTESDCTTDDGSATASPTGGTGIYTYLWDDASSQTTATATGLGAGTYTCTITDDNGCSIDVTVAVSNTDGPSLTIGGVDILCFGACDGEATISASGGTPGYTYLWDDPSAQTTETATGLCAGTFNVTVTDAAGCETLETITLVEPTELTAITSSNPETGICNGDATVTPSGGTPPYTFLWDVAAGSQTTATAIDLCEGDYCVTITDDNGCTLDECVTVSKNIGIHENLSAYISIYPNPTNQGYIQVNSGLSISVFATIYSSDGRLVRELIIKPGDNVLSVSNLASGIYVIQGNVEGESWKQRLVIN